MKLKGCILCLALAWDCIISFGHAVERRKGIIQYSTNDADNLAMSESLARLRADIQLSPVAAGATVRKIVDEWRTKGDTLADLFLINAGYSLSSAAELPVELRKGLARSCFKEVLRLSTEAPPRLEENALRYFDIYNDQLLDMAQWGLTRENRTEWWLHCWQRAATEADTIDGEHPRPDLLKLPLKLALPDGLTGVGSMPPELLPPGPVRDVYARDLAALHQKQRELGQIGDAINSFETIKASAEDFFTQYYSLPPYAFQSLITHLQSKLGDNHPAVRRIAQKVAQAERLPPEARAELESLIATLPPAGKPAEVRAARSASPAKLALPPIIPEPNSPFPAPPERKARKSKPAWMASREASAASPGTQGTVVAVAAADAAEASPQVVSYGLGAAALALILAVLWRAQSRARPRQSK